MPCGPVLVSIWVMSCGEGGGVGRIVVPETEHGYSTHTAAVLTLVQTARSLVETGWTGLPQPGPWVSERIPQNSPLFFQILAYIVV